MEYFIFFISGESVEHKVYSGFSKNQTGSRIEVWDDTYHLVRVTYGKDESYEQSIQSTLVNNKIDLYRVYHQSEDLVLTVCYDITTDMIEMSDASSVTGNVTKHDKSLSYDDLVNLIISRLGINQPNREYLDIEGISNLHL